MSNIHKHMILCLIQIIKKIPEMIGTLRLTSVPVFALFILLDDGTPQQVGLMIILFENPTKIAVKLGRPMRLY